jgi:hypothetical protein
MGSSRLRPVVVGAVSLAVLASCNTKGPESPEVTTTTSAPLSAAEIGAAQTAGLLPSSPQIQWMDPVTIPAGDSAPITSPNAVNNGVAVGIDYGSATSGGPYAIPIGYPFVLTSTGGNYVPGPFPGGSNYFTSVADDGTILGYGGPASGENYATNLELPFTLSPDGTYTMLNTTQGAPFDHVVTDSNQNLLYTGTSWDFSGITGNSGTIAHWLFNGDGTDQIGESPFTIDASHFAPISSQNPTQYLSMDGSECYYIAATTPWQQIECGNTIYPAVPAGITVMAWVNIPQSACDGPGNTSARVIFSSGQEVAVGIRCDAPSATATGAALTGLFATPTSYLLPTGPTNFLNPTPGHYLIPFNTWTHVALTWDHFVVRTYANGHEMDHFPYQGNFNPVWYWAWLTAGCDPLGSYNFIGGIRDLSVTRAPFGQEEIAQYMIGQGDYVVQQGRNFMRYRTNIVDGLPEWNLIPGAANGETWSGLSESGAATDGTIVGWGVKWDYTQRAMIYQPNVRANMTDLNAQLPTASGWDLLTADAINIINSDHVVVGQGNYAGFDSIGYKFDIEAGTITPLGFVDGGEWGGYTYASSINSSGIVAGVQRPAPWLGGAPFVYTDESGITNLNELFDPSVLNGYVLETATIDDRGEITGLAYNASLGKYRAYLMQLPGLPSAAQADGASFCSTRPDNTPCNDGDACTLTDTCQGGVCQGANSVVCTAIDQCHQAGICDPTTGACSTPQAPQGASCSDGNPCTLGDICLNGTCNPGSLVSCRPLGPCYSAGVCDPTTGQCSSPPVADNTACDDGNPCTQGDTCQGGSCIGGPPAGCGRTGQIDGTPFDGEQNVVAQGVGVTPEATGAWAQYNNVDFGEPGHSGRLTVLLANDPGNQDLQLYVDAPTGQPIADLLTLPTGGANPAPQGTDFLTPVSGIHTVFIVFATSDPRQNLEWFRLDKARGGALVADFPATFQHSNPGQNVPATLPVVLDAGDEEEYEPIAWYHTRGNVAIPLAPGEYFGWSFSLPSTLRAFGQARWIDPTANITITIYDSQQNILASAAPSSGPGGGFMDLAITDSLSPEAVSVRFTNSGTSIVRVSMIAGATP